MTGRTIYLILFCLVFLASCFEPPEIPEEPSIELKSFTFKETSEEGFDSLIIEIEFKDGDGDLGLTSFDTLPPYHDFWYYVDDEDNLIKYDPNNPDLPPFNCIDYEPAIDEGSNGQDTIVHYYVLRNENHFNFFLDFLVETNAGFVKYDFLKERCTRGFHGRFFPLNTTGKERPLEGVLRYGVESGFKFLFQNQPLKIQVQIQDRALNKSNIVTTEEFTLDI